MAFDATVGGSSANSYSSLADADSYFELRIDNSAWTALTDAQKQSYLVTATTMLETYVQWSGEKADSDQALHFPANYVYDCQGNLIDSDIIPESVKKALYEQVAYLLQTNSINNPAGISKGIKSAKVGDLSVEFDKYAVPQSLGKMVKSLVRCIGTIVNDSGAVSVSCGNVLKG